MKMQTRMVDVPKVINAALDAARPEFDTCMWEESVWEQFKLTVQVAVRLGLDQRFGLRSGSGR